MQFKNQLTKMKAHDRQLNYRNCIIQHEKIRESEVATYNEYVHRVHNRSRNVSFSFDEKCFSFSNSHNVLYFLSNV